MVEKALWVVRETLEKLSARVVAGRVFLRALPAVMETALHDVAKSWELQEGVETLEARVCALEEDLHKLEP